MADYTFPGGKFEVYPADVRPQGSQAQGSCALTRRGRLRGSQGRDEIDIMVGESVSGLVRCPQDLQNRESIVVFSLCHKKLIMREPQVLGVDKNPAVWSLVSEIVFKSSSPLPPPLPSPSTEKRAVRVTAAQAFSLPAAGEPGSVRFCEEHKSTIRPQEANTAITGAAGSSSAITGAMITQANTEAVMTRVTATAATSRAIPTGAVITSAKSTAINTWIAAGNAKLMTIAASAANTRSTVAGAVINIQHKSEEIVPKKRTRDALETSPEPVTKQAKHSQNHTASTASQPGPYPSLQEEDDMDAIPTAQPQYQMNVESQQTSKVVDEKPNFDDKVMDPSNSEELKRRKRNMLSILSDLDKRVGSLGDEQANEEKTTVVESILQEAFDRIERVFISSSSEKCSYST